MMAGGGALLEGFGARLTEETGMPTYMAADPLACVAVGAGYSLEEFETLARTSGGAPGAVTRLPEAGLGNEVTRRAANVEVGNAPGPWWARRGREEAGHVGEGHLRGGMLLAGRGRVPQHAGSQVRPGGLRGRYAPDPSYHQVCTGRTGHAEVVRSSSTPTQVAYEDLLEQFWSLHNPTTRTARASTWGRSTARRSSCTRPSRRRRRSGRARRRRRATASRSSPRSTPASTFYPAEDYHQRYLEKRGQATCAV